SRISLDVQPSRCAPQTTDNGLEVNVLKGKQLTNIRGAGKDEAVRLTPMKMPLGKALAYIQDGELAGGRLNPSACASAISIPTSGSAWRGRPPRWQGDFSDFPQAAQLHHHRGQNR